MVGPGNSQESVRSGVGAPAGHRAGQGWIGQKHLGGCPGGQGLGDCSLVSRSMGGLVGGGGRTSSLKYLPVK